MKYYYTFLTELPPQSGDEEIRQALEQAPKNKPKALDVIIKTLSKQYALEHIYKVYHQQNQ